MVKKQKLKFLSEENCDTCNGTGAKPGTKQKLVHIVMVHGQLNVEQNTPFGRIVNRRACNYCHGTGKEIKA